MVVSLVGSKAVSTVNSESYILTLVATRLWDLFMKSHFRFPLSAFSLGVLVCVAVGSAVVVFPSLAYIDTMGPAAIACTSLAYIDANSHVYQGRTMELMGDLPWQVVYFPAGQAFESNVNDDHPPLNYTSRYAIVAVALADVAPNSQDVPTLDHLKVIDGQNEAGLSFSLLAYATAAGPQSQVGMTRAILNVADLGTWTLGQFATVGEVKAALEDQPLTLASVDILHGAQPHSPWCPTTDPFCLA